MTNSLDRRDFIRALLAASACSIPYSSILGQQLPSDNAFQARLSHLFTRTNGRLQQILLVDMPQGRSSDNLEIIIGTRSQKIGLNSIRKIDGQYYVPIEPVDQEDTARLILKNSGKHLETSLQVRPVRHWEVYLLHNSHEDPGYLDLPSVMRARFVPFIDNAMKYCQETSAWPESSRFKWNIEVSYLVEDYRKARGPEKLQQVMNWVKNGRMTIGGLYCSTQTDFMSLETLHRSVYYATNRLTREFGINLEGAILDDENGFSWGLVEVMAKSGLRYLIMGSNGDRDNMQNGNAPTLFYLEGTSGSEILVWRSVLYPEGFDLITYSDPYSGRTVKGVNIEDGEKTIAPYFERHELAGYPFDTILLQAASDFVPPVQEFSEVVRTWNSQWAYPHLRLTTIPEFFYAIEAHRDQIPRLRGGAPSGWVDLHNTFAHAAALARRTEDRLPDAERLSTLAGLVAGDKPRQEEFFNAYNELILFEGHTIEWDQNADIYVPESQGGGKKHWEEKVAHVEFAHNVAEQIEQESLHSICGNIQSSAPLALAVWNPLSWTRSEILRTPVPKTAKSQFRLVDIETGKEILYQIESPKDGSPILAFYAENIPSLGYRMYKLEPGKPANETARATVSKNSLENSHYRIELSEKDGTVSSLFDKALQREFVDPKADHALNTLVYRLDERLNEREYKTLGELPMEDVTIQTGAQGPIFYSLKVSGHIGNICQFEHEILLYPDLKRVEFYNRIKKKPIYAKESVYYAFPFNVPTDIDVPIRLWDHFNMYRLDMPGSIMQPDIDQIPGSCRDSYVPQHWLSISRKDYGVLWSSADAPLVQLGGIHSEQYLLYLTMQDKNWLADARIYSYLMNNHWVVDCPIAQGGDDLFRYAVTTHGPDWTYDTAHRFGWGFMSPLRVFAVEGGGQGDLAEPARSFLKIHPENVYLAGFKASEDGDGVILRLYEGAGLQSSATIQFHLPKRKVIAAVSCDGREQNLSTLKADTASIEVSLKPFETSTVRVRFD